MGGDESAKFGEILVWLEPCIDLIRAKVEDRYRELKGCSVTDERRLLDVLVPAYEGQWQDACIDVLQISVAKSVRHIRLIHVDHASDPMHYRVTLMLTTPAMERRKMRGLRHWGEATA